MLKKPTTIKSKKIRNSAKGKSCTLRIPGICNGNRETTVFAHINTKFKGTGNKSPDLFGIYCCSDCHDWLDGRRSNQELYDTMLQRDSEILRAYIETLMKLYQQGLIEIS